MPYSSKQIFACGWLCVACWACGVYAAPDSSMSVNDLMEDRVTLDGVLMKCNQNPSKCAHRFGLSQRPHRHRAAGSKNVDPAVEVKHNEEFERAASNCEFQEKLRQEQEAKSKVDAYSLPVVPVDPPPPKSDPPPLAGTATP